MDLNRRTWLQALGLGAAVTVSKVDAATHAPTLVTLTADPSTEMVKTYANQSANAFQGVGLPSEWLDVQPGNLYSALEVGPELPTYPRYELFRDAIGQLVPWKHGRRLTLADTNMYCPSHLARPELFAVQRIGVIFSPTCDGAALRDFVAYRTLEFWICNKRYWVSPLSRLFNQGDLTRVDTDGEWVNPKYLVLTVELGKLPFILHSEMDFHVALAGDARHVAKSLRLWVVLDGLHGRPVH